MNPTESFWGSEFGTGLGFNFQATTPKRPRGKERGRQRERDRPRRREGERGDKATLGWGLSFGESWNQEIIIRSDRGRSGSAWFLNFHTPGPMSFFWHGVDLLVTANTNRDRSCSFLSSSSFSSVVHNHSFPH